MRIYVHESVYDKFVSAYVDQVKKYKLGDPTDSATNLGPVVSVASADRIRKQVDDAVKSGAKALVPEDLFPIAKSGTTYVVPQVLVNVDHTMDVMKEETFGPVVGIMPVASDEAALELMNDSPYGLTASIWTSDKPESEAAFLKLVDELETGTVFLNRCDYLDPALAWTGVKDSGRGVSLSKFGTPTQPLTSTDLAVSSAASSSVASSTTIRGGGTEISTIVTITQGGPSATNSISSSSTRSTSSTSARSSSSETNSTTPTSAPLTDVNVPFYQSKYYPMIIALCCFAVGLLIAFIVSVIIALRARSDVGDLRDRLNRYEEQMFFSKQAVDSTSNVGYEVPRSFGQRSYGRVDMSDSESTLVSRPRQSTGQTQREFGGLPSSQLGQGTTKTRSQTGTRRVTFSDEEHLTDASPLLSSSVFGDSTSQYTPTRLQAPAPKPVDPYGSSALVQSPPQLPSSPPQVYEATPFVLSPTLHPGASDPARVITPPIRRLPTTPGPSSSNQEHDAYANPFPPGHHSANDNYQQR
ncbi:aldehyde dehydrogenase [Rhizoctonia solani AG-1 IB]|uniref:Aldehyde dehydrogenase n=1 Tax=Thanatephorus cucumeris (strain AG1-IB / isolate 7/3/14) TaxID=1108050 RepID=M5BST9_THACB|nr:aldehyde dehydrogenase [Rhizoctonia solani AG-1 IB]